LGFLHLPFVGEDFNQQGEVEFFRYTPQIVGFRSGKVITLPEVKVPVSAAGYGYSNGKLYYISANWTEIISRDLKTQTKTVIRISDISSDKKMFSDYVVENNVFVFLICISRYRDCSLAVVNHQGDQTIIKKLIDLSETFYISKDADVHIRPHFPEVNPKNLIILVAETDGRGEGCPNYFAAPSCSYYKFTLEEFSMNQLESKEANTIQNGYRREHNEYCHDLWMQAVRNSDLLTKSQGMFLGCFELETLTK